MYLLIVLLTMLVLPAGSIAWEHNLNPEANVVVLTGRWFVFWAVGVRLGLAGLRQFFQPAFTAREIFHMEGGEALVLVRELGVANFAAAVVALASIVAPSFVLPAAVSATIFYGVAGIRHVGDRERSPHQTIALVSDLFIFLVLGGFVGLTVMGRVA